MAVLGKFNYEISQSVSSSFQQGDTLELTFQAKGSSGLATSAQQKVNLFYTFSKFLYYLPMSWNFPTLKTPFTIKIQKKYWG